jgi:DNA-binding CsgD family transcriptional regulator
MRSRERSSSFAVGRNNYALSPLELQVIALVAGGFTRKESAPRMGVSEHTYQQQRANLLDKLRVANRVELVLFAPDHQVIRKVQVFPLEAAWIGLGASVTLPVPGHAKPSDIGAGRARSGPRSGVRDWTLLCRSPETAQGITFRAGRW